MTGSYRHSFLVFVMFLVALVLQPSVMQAQLSSERRAETAAKLTAALAIDEQLTDIAADIQLQFSQNPLQVPESLNSAMLQEFETAYNSDSLRSAFIANIQSQLSPSDVTAIRTMLGNAALQPALQAVQEFYTLQGKRKRVVHLYEMEGDSVSARREQLLGSIIDDTQQADLQVESTIIVLRSILNGMNGLSDRSLFTDAQINQIARNFKAQARVGIEKELLDEYRLKFYELSDEQLQQYHQFWASEAGSRITELLNAGMQYAYEQSARQLATPSKTQQ